MLEKDNYQVRIITICQLFYLISGFQLTVNNTPKSTFRVTHKRIRVRNPQRGEILSFQEKTGRAHFPVDLCNAILMFIGLEEIINLSDILNASCFGSRIVKSEGKFKQRKVFLWEKTCGIVALCQNSTLEEF